MGALTGSGEAGHAPSTCSRRAATSAAFRRWLLAPEAFLEDAGCWQASLQNARELFWKRLERENVHASVALAGVWMVLGRGLLLDRLKRARPHDAVTREGGALAGSAFFKTISPKCDPSLRWPPPEPTQ